MWIRGGGKTLIHKMWIKNMCFLKPLPNIDCTVQRTVHFSVYFTVFKRKDTSK